MYNSTKEEPHSIQYFYPNVGSNLVVKKNPMAFFPLLLMRASVLNPDASQVPEVLTIAAALFQQSRLTNHQQVKSGAASLWEK